MHPTVQVGLYCIQRSGKPTGTIYIEENGLYDVAKYADADVQISQPSGSTTITQNGSYDVAQYSTAVVDVTTADPIFAKANIVNQSTREITVTSLSYQSNKICRTSVAVPPNSSKEINACYIITPTDTQVAGFAQIDAGLEISSIFSNSGNVEILKQIDRQTWLIRFSRAASDIEITVQTVNV